MTNSGTSTTSTSENNSFLSVLKNTIAGEKVVSEKNIHHNLDLLNSRITRFMAQAEKLENSLKKSSDELNHGKSDR